MTKKKYSWDEVIHTSQPHRVKLGTLEVEKRRKKDRKTYLRKVLRKFGMTIEAYEAMSAEQDGLCAICRRPETRTRNGRTTSLAVDHDHRTNKVRGLLCAQCNLAVGIFERHEGGLAGLVAYFTSN